MDAYLFTPGSDVPFEQNPCGAGSTVHRGSVPLSRKRRIMGAPNITQWLTTLAPIQTTTNVSAYYVPTRQHRSTRYPPQASRETTWYSKLWKANVTETEKAGKQNEAGE